MVTIHARRPLLLPADITPSRPDMQVVGIFNPGAIDCGDHTLILARVSEAPIERRDGWHPAPRWRSDGSGLELDWLPATEWSTQDSRSLEHRDSGFVRLTFTSHLRAIRHPLDLQRQAVTPPQHPLLPQGELEIYGIEDPRITRVDNDCLLSYVCVSPAAACTALARTRDGTVLDRLGVCFPPENKDVVLFPERIAGRLAALHRPNPRYRFRAPEIWIGFSPDGVHWGDHRPLRWPRGASDAAWCAGKTGAGCVPVRTAAGWLVIYHGNARPPADASSETGAYVAAALLLDLEDPTRVIATTPEPLIAPTTAFERDGFLPDVIFPTALLDRGTRWAVVYGAADTSIGVLEIDKSDLEAALVRA
ncbi:MAG: hypothetical protein ACOCZK_04505 [Planctomycetota bacterium]